MKWVLLNRTHVNTDLVSAFRWEDGYLLLWFVGDPVDDPAHYPDPEKKIYTKLCHQLGNLSAEEVTSDGKN